MVLCTNMWDGSETEGTRTLLTHCKYTFSGEFLASRSAESVSQMSVVHDPLSSALPSNSSAQTGCYPGSPHIDAPAGSGRIGGSGMVQPVGCEPVLLCAP